MFFQLSFNRIIKKVHKASRYVFVSASILMLILNGSCQGISPPPVSTSDSPDLTGVIVMVRSNSFDPQVIQVELGETVTWINNDSVSHTVTSWRQYTADDGWKYAEIGTIWDSGDIKPGESYSRTFDQPGSYQYTSFPMYLYTVFQLQNIGTVSVSVEQS